jgi:RES domain-containing protein
MVLWRISRYPGLSGAGGSYTDGRWHTMPKQVLYLAEHPALAMVEVMAHLDLTIETLPVNLKLIRVDLLDGASIADTPALPSGWQANQPTSQRVGNLWLQAGTELVLPLPSALINHTTNYLINAAHPQAATHLAETLVEPFWIDARFVR